jgi:hypothetical protein
MKASNAKLSISSSGEYFPLTNYRVILIKGNLVAINIAQSTLWRIVASANAAKGVEETEVSGHILIPEAASGLIIGRGGINIKRISTESGALCSLDSKEEVLFGERIMSISGPLDGCITAVSMVIEKFMEEPTPSQYLNKSPRYNSSTGIFAYGNNGGKGSLETSSGPGYRVVSAETTIIVAVTDHLVGSVLGTKGAVLRELESISGADIAISSRADMSDSAKERIITITGEPSQAQAALILITQKVNSQVTFMITIYYIHMKCIICYVNLS